MAGFVIGVGMPEMHSCFTSDFGWRMTSGDTSGPSGGSLGQMTEADPKATSR
jgi:hypothetical protein